MNMEQNTQRSFIEDAKHSANIFAFLAWVWGTSLQVFIRKNMGRRYLGWNAIFVFALIPCFSLLWPPQDTGALYLFLGAYMFMAAYRRMQSLRVDALSEHSYYTGFPTTMKKGPNMDEVSYKLYSEPILVVIIGAMVTLFSKPLGWYIIFGGFALLIQASISKQLTDAEIMDTNDAMLDQQIVAEQFRRRVRR